MESNSLLKRVFNVGIDSVKPCSLIDNLPIDNRFRINDQEIELRDNIYVVGFGKAALGFLGSLYSKIERKYRRGIFSVPKPTELEIQQNPNLFSVSKEVLQLTSIYYGSRSNVPNTETLKASIEIRSLVESLTASDSLIVVITGGGSALLCLPHVGITLEDITTVTSKLALAGASIIELNIVRRSIDMLKGGGLAALSRSFNIISLILSDVIGDNLSIIASGPTVLESHYSMGPLDIISKYDLMNEIPFRILDFLNSERNETDSDLFKNRVFNFIVGNNKIALKSMSIEVEKHDFASLIISSEIDGDCELRSQQLIQFLENIFQYLKCQSEENKLRIHSSARLLKSKEEDINNILPFFLKNMKNRKGFCLLLGGEMPVKIKNTKSPGIGGRCSHMALSTACLMENSFLKDLSINILFGASDGMDGATDYAGAMIYSNIISHAKESKIDPIHYLNSYDSYNFFKQFENGKYLLNTGMTGTNVMDFILILIPNKNIFD